MAWNEHCFVILCPNLSHTQKDSQHREDIRILQVQIISLPEVEVVRRCRGGVAPFNQDVGEEMHQIPFLETSLQKQNAWMVSNPMVSHIMSHLK